MFQLLSVDLDFNIPCITSKLCLDFCRMHKPFSDQVVIREKKMALRPKPNEYSNLFKSLHLHPQAFLSVQAHVINVILFLD